MKLKYLPRILLLLSLTLAGCGGDGSANDSPTPSPSPSPGPGPDPTPIPVTNFTYESSPANPSQTISGLNTSYAYKVKNISDQDYTIESLELSGDSLTLDTTKSDSCYNGKMLPSKTGICFVYIHESALTEETSSPQILKASTLNNALPSVTIKFGADNVLQFAVDLSEKVKSATANMSSISLTQEANTILPNNILFLIKNSGNFFINTPQLIIDKNKSIGTINEQTVTLNELIDVDQSTLISYNVLSPDEVLSTPFELVLKKSLSNQQIGLLINALNNNQSLNLIQIGASNAHSLMPNINIKHPLAVTLANSLEQLPSVTGYYPLLNAGTIKNLGTQNTQVDLADLLNNKAIEPNTVTNNSCFYQLQDNQKSLEPNQNCELLFNSYLNKTTDIPWHLRYQLADFTYQSSSAYINTVIISGGNRLSIDNTIAQPVFAGNTTNFTIQNIGITKTLNGAFIGSDLTNVHFNIADTLMPYIADQSQETSLTLGSTANMSLTFKDGHLLASLTDQLNNNEQTKLITIEATDSTGDKITVTPKLIVDHALKVIGQRELLPNQTYQYTLQNTDNNDSYKMMALDTNQLPQGVSVTGNNCQTLAANSSCQIELSTDSSLANNGVLNLTFHNNNSPDEIAHPLMFDLKANLQNISTPYNDISHAALLAANQNNQIVLNIPVTHNGSQGDLYDVNHLALNIDTQLLPLIDTDHSVLLIDTLTPNKTENFTLAFKPNTIFSADDIQKIENTLIPAVTITADNILTTPIYLNINEGVTFNLNKIIDQPGKYTYTLTNNDAQAVTVDQIDLSQLPTGVSLTDDSCYGQTIQKSQTCILELDVSAQAKLSKEKSNTLSLAYYFGDKDTGNAFTLNEVIHIPEASLTLSLQNPVMAETTDYFPDSSSADIEVIVENTGAFDADIIKATYQFTDQNNQTVNDFVLDSKIDTLIPAHTQKSFRFTKPQSIVAGTYMLNILPDVSSNIMSALTHSFYVISPSNIVMSIDNAYHEKHPNMVKINVHNNDANSAHLQPQLTLNNHIQEISKQDSCSSTLASGKTCAYYYHTPTSFDVSKSEATDLTIFATAKDKAPIKGNFTLKAKSFLYVPHYNAIFQYGLFSDTQASIKNLSDQSTPDALSALFATPELSQEGRILNMRNFGDGHIALLRYDNNNASRQRLHIFYPQDNYTEVADNPFKYIYSVTNMDNLVSNNRSLISGALGSGLVLNSRAVQQSTDLGKTWIKLKDTNNTNWFYDSTKSATIPNNNSYFIYPRWNDKTYGVDVNNNQGVILVCNGATTCKKLNFNYPSGFWNKDDPMYQTLVSQMFQTTPDGQYLVLHAESWQYGVTSTYRRAFLTFKVSSLLNASNNQTVTPSYSNILPVKALPIDLSNNSIYALYDNKIWRYNLLSSSSSVLALPSNTIMISHDDDNNLYALAKDLNNQQKYHLYIQRAASSSWQSLPHASYEAIYAHPSWSNAYDYNDTLMLISPILNVQQVVQ